MILFDMPPPPFSDPVSSIVGIGFFLLSVAFAVISFIRLKSKVNVWFRLIIAATIFVIAVIASLIVSMIVAQLTYTRTYPPNRPPYSQPPYSNSR